MITGGDEVCILPPPILSETGVGIPTLSISLFSMLLRVACVDCLLAFFVRFAAVWFIALMLLLVLYASLLCCALLYCNAMILLVVA